MGEHIGQPQRCSICKSFEPCFVARVEGKLVWRCFDCVDAQKWR